MSIIIIVNIIVVSFASFVYILSNNVKIKHVLRLTRSYYRFQVVIFEKIEKSNVYHTIFKFD